MFYVTPGTARPQGSPRMARSREQVHAGRSDRPHAHPQQDRVAPSSSARVKMAPAHGGHSQEGRGVRGSSGFTRCDPHHFVPRDCRDRLGLVPMYTEAPRFPRCTAERHGPHPYGCRVCTVVGSSPVSIASARLWASGRTSRQIERSLRSPGSSMASCTCPSRKLEALHTFDFFRFRPHAGSADSSIFRHAMVRRVLIMLPVISALLAFVAGLFRSRASLCLEHLALRHQLAVYQQTIPRPRLRPTDRLMWVWLSRLWAGWQESLAFVQPRTVIAWQRKRFRDH